MLTFQQIILTLQSYWDNKGCALLQPIDMEVGAGTFHTATFLRAHRARAVERGLRPAFAPPDRRPLRRKSLRLQHYYQFQVVIKPSPHDILELYLG